MNFVQDALIAGVLTGLIIFVCSGLGQLVQAAYHPGKALNTEDASWLGFLVAITVLAALQVIVRPHVGILCILCAIAFVGRIVVWRRSRVAEAKMHFRAWHLLLVPIALATSIQIMKTPAVYDAGLYYVQTIKWLSEYPLVAGLGALDARVGSNQAWFLLPAWLNTIPGFDSGLRLSAVVALVLGVSVILRTDFQLERGQIVIKALLLLVLLVNTLKLSSSSPDIVVNTLEVVLLTYGMRLLAREPSDKINCTELYLPTLACIGLLCLVKTSGLLFAVTFFGVFVWTQKHSIDRRLVAVAAGLLFLAGITHATRGYLLNGAPLFPSTILRLDALPWSLDSHVFSQFAGEVKAWARLPGENYRSALQGRAWVAEWVSAPRNIVRVLLPLAISSFLLALPLLSGKNRNDGVIRLYALVLPFLVGIISTFILAPDARFMGPLVWLLCVLSLVINLHIFSDEFFTFADGYLRLLQKYEHFILVFLVAIVMTAMALGSESKFRAIDAETIELILRKGYQPLPSVAFDTVVTESGLRVNVPVQGDQCWGVPLPCTAGPNLNLQLVGTEWWFPSTYFTLK
jgi:hypothetical protein